MGIQVGSNFDLQTGLALDSRTVVADLTARDAILAGVRYEGLETYVESEEKSYKLVGGILDADWSELPSVAGSNNDSIINALIFG